MGLKHTEVLRIAGSVVMGLGLATVVVLAIEATNQVFDAATARDVVMSTSVTAQLLTVAGWALGAALGGWMSARLSRYDAAKSSGIVGAALLLGQIVVMLSIPYPLWMWVSACVVLPGAALFGGAYRSRTPEQAR